MRTWMSYTYSRSTERQTQFQLPTTQYGGLTLTGNQLEENERTVQTGWKVSGTYHRWVWADYYFVYYLVRIGRLPGEAWHQWEPDHFEGQVTDRNPNCCKPRTSKKLGLVAFREPKYNRGPGGNWAVVLRSNNPPFVRSSGTRESSSLGKAARSARFRRGSWAAA